MFCWRYVANPTEGHRVVFELCYVFAPMSVARLASRRAHLLLGSHQIVASQHGIGLHDEITQEALHCLKYR
jgi:hypothetical protein